jgi:hypothetical protein
VADATVVVDFIANTKGLQKGAQEASSSGSKLGNSLKGIGKAAAFGAGAAGIGALVAGLKIGIGEFAQGQKVAAQTAAVLKSTGSAAGVTADHVSSLATALMKKSGIDDEAIASGENLLLTFTNIKNEAGKGNDIFDRTTKIMTDMAVALGEDPQKAAIGLGKALNDPVKGVTALSKVGVSFSEAQKKTIKAMVASGDTMGAQKVILRELKKEFGGSAEAAGKTLPGMLNIAKESFSNFAGDLVAKSIPVLQQVVGWLRDHWPEITAAINAWWAAVKPTIDAFVALALSVVDVFVAHWAQIKPIVLDFAVVFQAAMKVIQDAIKIVTDILRGDWGQAWQDAKQLVADALTLLRAIIQAAMDEYKLLLSAAWAAIKVAAAAAWDGFKALAKAALDAVVTFATGLPGRIVGIDIPGKLKAVATSAGSFFLTAIKNKITDVVSALKGLPGRIEDIDIPGKLLAIGKSAGGKILQGIKDGINGAIRLWNSLAFNIPAIRITVDLPIVGKQSHTVYGGTTINFPDLPLLASGGVLTRPTVFVGGEAGREIVSPEALLRQIIREEGAVGGNYSMTLVTQRADAADVAWGFRRLELLRAGR